jgi:hypothetical protein
MVNLQDIQNGISELKIALHIRKHSPTVLFFERAQRLE